MRYTIFCDGGNLRAHPLILVDQNPQPYMEIDVYQAYWYDYLSLFMTVTHINSNFMKQINYRYVWYIVITLNINPTLKWHEMPTFPHKMIISCTYNYILEINTTEDIYSINVKK